MYIFSGQNCQTVNVKLKNEVLNKYKFLQGDYQISTTVNGEPSWKNGDYAIWSVMSREQTWIIESFNKLGEDYNAWIFAESDGLTNIYNKWNFWNGSSFIPPSNPEDIRITCNGKYSKHTLSIVS